MFRASRFLILILIILQTFSSVSFSESLPGKLADDFNDAARRLGREADDAAATAARRAEAIEAQRINDIAEEAIAREGRAIRKAQDDIDNIIRKEQQEASDLALQKQQAEDLASQERQAAQKYQDEMLEQQRRLDDQAAQKANDLLEQARLARRSDDVKKAELDAYFEQKRLDEEQFLKRKQDDIDAFEKKQADINAHYEKKLEEELADANDYVDLSTPQRREHILDGDASGGGHRSGTGNPGKSEFPQSWSDDKIMHEISDIATDPKSTIRSSNHGRTITEGTREEVDIKVIQEHNGEIVTGYPTNVPRNPK